MRPNDLQLLLEPAGSRSSSSGYWSRSPLRHCKAAGQGTCTKRKESARSFVSCSGPPGAKKSHRSWKKLIELLLLCEGTSWKK